MSCPPRQPGLCLAGGPDHLHPELQLLARLCPPPRHLVSPEHVKTAAGRSKAQPCVLGPPCGEVGIRGLKLLAQSCSSGLGLPLSLSTG